MSTYDEADTATLARRILELENGAATPEEAMDQQEWMDLMEALWQRLRSDGESRQGVRLPATSTATLQRQGEMFSARITDVSHGGIKIAGPECEALSRGARISWVGSRIRGADVSLQVPCEVLWVANEEGQEPVAGLGFNQSKRWQWGKEFFRWYLHTYRGFLEQLCKG
jgi:hypothetical protein